MGKLETNSGNEDVQGEPDEKGLYVGQEVCPDGSMLHVATGPGERPTRTQFDALRAAAKNSNITLFSFWQDLSAVCPAWSGRVQSAMTARGFTQAQARQAARNACAA
jgi:hypothetical protein